MQFSIISFALTLITTSLLALAAPAIPAGVVPAAVFPAGINLSNATAGYNATHGLAYNKELHGPLTQRDLVARQSYSGDATFFYPGLGACEGTNNQWEHVVALNAPQWNNKANCWRTITIDAYGKQVKAAIVDMCPGCGWGSLDMSPALFQQFTSLDTGRFHITWSATISNICAPSEFSDVDVPMFHDTNERSSSYQRMSQALKLNSAVLEMLCKYYSSSVWTNQLRHDSQPFSYEHGCLRFQVILVFLNFPDLQIPNHYDNRDYRGEICPNEDRIWMLLQEVSEAQQKLIRLFAKVLDNHLKHILKASRSNYSLGLTSTVPYTIAENIQSRSPILDPENQPFVERFIRICPRPSSTLLRQVTLSAKEECIGGGGQTPLTTVRFSDLQLNMSADPPDSPTNHERSRHWITDVEVTPANSDPNCKFSAKMFVDDELVCDLPAIDNTRPLQWSGLLLCNISPASTVALRLCKSIKNKPRYFNFPPFAISEADEETGEATLELPKAAWVVTIKSLTPAVANQLFPDELERFNAIEGVCDSLQSEATLNYMFKYALQFASLVATAVPESAATVSFLIYMKTWDVLDQQAQLDVTVQAILRGLTRIRDIVEIVTQASNSMLTTSMSHLMEVIHSILALLEDVSAYIFGRCTVNDLANIPSEDADVGDKYDVEAYIRGLEELQKAFYSSWSPTSASPDTSQEINVISDNASVEDDVLTTSDESAKTAVDWYEIINLLRPINPSGYDPDQACLDGTREVLLNKVMTWTQNRENAQTFMWISGQVGMGKTTVATSLCQRLDRVQALAGAFFCVRDDPHYNNPLLLINNLICDLAMSCPAYAHQVAIAIRANPKLCSSHLSLRFEGLVKRPLQKLARISMPITLVAIIDGLDECGDHVARGKMLQNLYEMSRLVPWLKVIVTGRPVADIQQYFRDTCLHKTVMHLYDYDASPDIRAYIEGQVTQLAETERWPSDSVDQLCTMSCGVFLWATLAVKYIKQSAFPALPRLRKLLSNQKSPVTDHFDKLYTSVLKTTIDDNENETKVAYLRCIGAILVTSAREPRAAPHLQHLLLGASQVDHLTLEQTKVNLGPLLLVADERHITFHHPSFKDFVTDPSRSGPFYIRLDHYEAEPAAYCLQVMQRDLCFNICQLETSHRLNKEITDLSHRIDSHIGPVLAYACTHWIDHFIASPTQALVESIKKFMEGPQLMYWIEVLSLLGSIDIALEGLTKLAGLDPTRFGDSGLVISWAKDAHRFILSFYDAITASAPHLYVSALAFAPAKCLTALRMRPLFPNTIAVAQGGNRDWHPCIKSAVHPYVVQTLSTSPDGRHVVVGYLDGSLAVWDMQTGACLEKSLVGHRDVVTCAVYSPDGNLVASSSYDTTIPSGGEKGVRLWNALTGQLIGQPFTEHTNFVLSVAFSPDGNYLLSGAADNKIQVRDIAALCTGIEPEKELSGAFRWPSNPYEMTSHPQHSGWVTHDQESLAFWLPAHYEQHETFLDPIQQAPCSPVYLDYSKFVHGTAWTEVARNPASNSSE
ncbi:vegetative incompatibility protein HET-E-1, putative, partial [Rhizoctonia solani AG-3 Rhs1AP]